MGLKEIREASGRIVGVIGTNPEIAAYDVGGLGGVVDLVPELMELPAAYQRDLDLFYNFRYFRSIADYLGARGYIAGTNLFGIPYDFRRVLDPAYRQEIFANIAKYVELGRSRTGGLPAVVVAHSLGALLFKWFLSTTPPGWNREHIAEFISISAPYGGSPNSMVAVLAGQHYLPIYQSIFREELSRNTGLIACLPNALGSFPSEIHYEFDNRQIIRLQDYGTLAAEAQLPFEIWQDLYKPHFPDIFNTEKDVRTISLISTRLATGVRFRARKIEEYPYDTTYAYGDSVVPARSLHAARGLFRHLTEIEIPNANHTGILNHLDTHAIIYKAATATSI